MAGLMPSRICNGGVKAGVKCYPCAYYYTGEPCPCEPEMLDPRWDWIHVPEIGNPDQWVKGQCKHLEIEPIRDVSGELVARWCRTCDKQWTIPIEIR